MKNSNFAVWQRGQPHNSAANIFNPPNSNQYSFVRRVTVEFSANDANAVSDVILAAVPSADGESVTGFVLDSAQLEPGNGGDSDGLWLTFEPYTYYQLLPNESLVVTPQGVGVDVKTLFIEYVQQQSSGSIY